VCDHPDRSSIEAAILEDGKSIVRTAYEWDFEEQELREHCRKHLRIEPIGDIESHPLTKSKTKEIKLLQEASFSYYLTLKSLERVIHDKLRTGNLNGLTRSAVDLYLGCGAEMRGSIDSMFKSFQILMGVNPSSSQLAELSAVLQASMQACTPQEQKPEQTVLSAGTTPGDEK
jgi:hypothetical protein